MSARTFNLLIEPILLLIGLVICLTVGAILFWPSEKQRPGADRLAACGVLLFILGFIFLFWDFHGGVGRGDVGYPSGAAMLVGIVCIVWAIATNSSQEDPDQT
jgi:uncharacterized membrane protein HdeD (DUF308 family)